MFRKRQKLIPFVVIDALQPCNYQVSKKVVHKIKFGAVAVMQIYSDVYFILIGSMRCLKEAKTMDMIALYKC